MIVPEWVWGILGVIIMGLIGLIYKNMLTKPEHNEICNKNTKKLVDDFGKVVKDEIEDVKEYFDLKIENVVMKELRKINGRSD